MINKTPVIGITGGIGAGKTAVAQLLGKLGGLVLDSDRLAHEELAKADVCSAIRQRWGDSVFTADGQVDRVALGRRVFSDPRELRQLEELLYPRIHRRRWEIIEQQAGRPGVRAIIIDAPKLYEAGVDKECDAVIFVDADEDVRAERVARHRGWDRAELHRREKLQIPLDKKRALADYVVVNNHPGVDSLLPQVQRILDSVVGSVAKP